MKIHQKTVKHKRHFIPLQIKLCIMGVLATGSLIYALPSSATGENGNTATEQAQNTSNILAKNSDTLAISVAQTSADANSCNNPANVNGLAFASTNKWQDMQKLITADVGIDKMFDAAKDGGCFNALQNFPNLSVAIPSLTSIATSLKETAIKYAKRKACTAVNEALTDLLEPVNKVIDQVAAHGQLDLTGVVNDKLSKTYYSIDPEMGQVAETPNGGYSWSLDKDVLNSDSAKASSNSNNSEITNSINNAVVADTTLNGLPQETNTNSNKQNKYTRESERTSKAYLDKFFGGN